MREIKNATCRSRIVNVRSMDFRGRLGLDPAFSAKPFLAFVLRVKAHCGLILAEGKHSTVLNNDFTCAVKRRWSTAGESPARELGSLHPEAIGAAVEETKPSEPPV